VTDRAFVLIVCGGCSAGQGVSVLDELRPTIRSCPHGVLIAAGCMLGTLTCESGAVPPGVLVLLQPCSPDRTPVGPARWIGPIDDRHDAVAVADWVRRSDWRLGALPQRLRSTMNAVRQVAGKN